jgi:hypothetical protein
MDWIRPWLCKHVNRKGVYHMFSRRARPRYRAPFYAAPRGRTAEQAKRASRASDRERGSHNRARVHARLLSLLGAVWGAWGPTVSVIHYLYANNHIERASAL